MAMYEAHQASYVTAKCKINLFANLSGQRDMYKKVDKEVTNQS